jgi:hypothetical protein
MQDTPYPTTIAHSGKDQEYMTSTMHDAREVLAFFLRDK